MSSWYHPTREHFKKTTPSSISFLVVFFYSKNKLLNVVLPLHSTQGTVTATGCAPWGTGSACQEAINQNDWCTNYQADAPSVTVSYNAAATLGITVTSNKSLIGSGSSGVIKGRGLRVVSGASNVIIQNIEITNLNPKYVWGGDAITLNDCDLVWIDHVTVSRPVFVSFSVATPFILLHPTSHS